MKEVVKPKPVNKGHIMETYAEDMVGVISSDKEGLVQRIIHEQEEREAEKKNSSPYSGQNKLLLVVSLVFLFLAFGVVSYYYFFYTKTLTTEVSVPFKSIILTENNAFIGIDGLSKLEIASKIGQQKEITKIKKDEIEGLYFTESKKVIGWSRFNTLIKSNLIQPKTPVINENFLLGIISFETKEITIEAKPKEVGLLDPAPLESSPIPIDTYVESFNDPLRYQVEKPTHKDLFIMVLIKSFADAFPVMTNWESKMFLDLHDIYGIDLNADQSYLLTKDWDDGIVQNKNARILHDKEGRIVLMYVYADDNHIIFANTEESVKEVIDRLVTSKVRK